MEHPGAVDAFDLAGERLATFGADHFVRIWDWRRGDLAGMPFEQGFEKYTGVMAILPAAGGGVFTVSEDSVRVSEIQTGKPVLPRSSRVSRHVRSPPSKDRVFIGSQIQDTDVRGAAEAGGRLPPALWGQLAEARLRPHGPRCRCYAPDAAAWLEQWEALRRAQAA